MRHFWALPGFLRVALVLAAQKQFQVHDDLLAFPQYEVQYSEDYVTEVYARSKLLHSIPLHQQTAQATHPHTDVQVDRYRPPEETPDPSQDNNVYYEEMMTEGTRYLCAIPDVDLSVDNAQSRSNDTITEQEREAELADANTRGWELMSGMQGNCVYFNDGWWSYSYCFNTGVRQFHQLAHTRNAPVWPPVEDPVVLGFDLGTHEQDKSVKEAGEQTPHKRGELVVKGKSKYLLQRLGGGTVCDLTGKPRSIEVQFHCNPLYAYDVISWIKELSTCTYLMVIQTPRLCSDVAFQPPKKDKPNAIVCQQIIKPEDIPQYETDRQLLQEIEEAFDKAAGSVEPGTASAPKHQFVGDILVGGHNIVPEGVKIEKSAIVGGGKERFLATIADSDGAMISKFELEKLKIGDMKTITELKERVKKLAAGNSWKLDLVETAAGPEFRGIFGSDDKQESKKLKNEDQKDDEGSEEEFYKEEL